MEQIRLDIVPKGIMPVCHASQYDKGRVIRCNLMDGLQGYVLTDETIVLKVCKPDDNIVTAAVEVVSGTSYVDIVTTEQMTACEGNNICELTMSKGDVVISTLNFRMQVEVDPLKDGVESETVIHNLESMVDGMVAEEVATQYDSSNVIFDNEPTENHGIGYTVTSEGIKTAIDNAFDYDNTASGSLVHITDGADNIPVKSLVSEIVAVESGSGEKSPTNPYTISGFDSGIITRCGKNLLKTGLASQTYNGITFTVNSDGTITLSGTATAEIYRTFHIYLPKGSYVYSSGVTESLSTFDTYIAKDRTAIARGNSVAPGPNFTLTEFSDLVLNIRVRNGISPNTTLKLMVRVATDTDDTFVPYNGNNYTFDFGQTVYGGTLDVLTGVLTVDKGFLTFDGTETWNHDLVNNRNRFICTELPSLGVTAQTTFDAISNYLVGYNDPTRFAQQDYSFILRYINNQNRIDIMFNSISTEADFKSYLSSNPLQVCFELATPITYQLTPTEVKTLLGENNIYSNTGDIDVTYYTYKSNDILEFVDSEIGKKNGTNIPIEENSQDSIKDYIDDEISSTKDYIDDEISSTKDYIDNGLNGKVDEGDCVPFELDYPSSITGLVKYANGCYYNPQTNEVHINIVIYSNENNIPNNNGVIATIPNEYRPSAERVVASFSEILDENNALHFEAIQPIGTNGEVKLHNFVYSGLINTICMNFVYYK